MERNKKDMIFFEREAVIKTPKSRIIAKLASLIELDSEKEEFLKMCKRLEYIFRSWYLTQFEDLMQLYSIFDPSHGAEKLQQQSLSPCDVDNLEQNFLKNLFQVMEKSHFKLYSDKEAEVAASSDYLLTLPISLDESQFDSRLLTRFFQENPHENLPQYANKFVIFRRGIGIHRTSGYFIMEKVDMLLSRGLNWLLILTGHECKSIVRSGYRMGKLILHSGYWMGKKKSQPSTMVLDHATGSKGSRRMSKKVRNPDEGLYIERSRIENMDCSLRNLFGENTIQEPTFEQMVIVYRLAVPHSDKLQSNDRSIHIEHFKDIPMADMEMILPAKKNPSLTPMDLVQFLISTIVGLAALIGSLEMPQNVWVAFAISSALVGYCTNIYSTFQQNKENYQNLMTKLMYDKHLNHGRGTLLHICHDVIIQEVKESIISLFILMQQGKTSIEDLDYRCEELLESKFGEKCDLDVVDTIMKLERLGIIFQANLGRRFTINEAFKHERIITGRAVKEESLGRVYVPSVTRVNEIIGITTEEIVAKARDGLT